MTLAKNRHMWHTMIFESKIGMNMQKKWLLEVCPLRQAPLLLPRLQSQGNPNVVSNHIHVYVHPYLPIVSNIFDLYQQVQYINKLLHLLLLLHFNNSKFNYRVHALLTYYHSVYYNMLKMPTMSMSVLL